MRQGDADQITQSRREFLARSASIAGLGAAASILPAGMLLREAARAQASALPAPGAMPIDHFVVVMMENRSFDHYFGWLGDTAAADGIQQQTFIRESDGQPVATRHASTLEAQFQGCGHPDPGHGWDNGRDQMRAGFLADGAGNDEFALTYYNRGEAQFIHGAAEAFTVYDKFFCSALTSTWPNRYFMWSGQAGGIKNNNPPIATAGNQWNTIFDLALRNNPSGLPLPGALTARYYNSDLPFSAVWGPRAVPWTRPLPEYYADCAAGTLPNITFVDPPFRDGGGGDGLSADEHPHGDIRLGQAWMADVVNAFVASKNYERGALFVVYDEWGGFFDHVRPPRVADQRASANPDEDWGQMGFRIPAVGVSPYLRRRPNDPVRARGAQVGFGFESILKLISYRFGLGNLNVRHAAAENIGTSFDWTATDMERPDLPDPVHVASRPCALGGGDVLEESSAQAHTSDLAALEALADRMGFKSGSGKAHELFTKPDAITKAVAATKAPAVGLR